jgi:non-ribosomal peptide synthase protein (TIGR01720 family)
VNTPADAFRSRFEALSPEQRGVLAERLAERVRTAERDAGEPAAGATQLVAYVVPADGHAGALDAAELRDFLRDRLPEYMVPGAVVLLEELPRLPNGKVDVRALPEPSSMRDESSESYVPPRSASEQALAEIWADVLGTDRIGAHDNFFEIGGDSILGIQVVARASRAGLSLSSEDLFRHRTLADLAAAAGTASAAKAEQGLVSGPVPLTPIQHWFFEQPLPEPHHWHHALWLEMPSTLETRLLEEAVRQVVLHHDALRLRFTRDASGWTQFHSADAAAPVTHVDFSGLPEPEQLCALNQAADEVAAVTDLAHGPLLQVRRFVLGGARPDRLLIAVHHLVMDPISWGILLEDLAATIAQLGRGDEIRLPPKTTSFQAWAEALSAFSESEALLAERAFWQATQDPVPRLPVDSPGVFTEGSAETVTTFLGDVDTRSLLRDAPAAYGTHPEEIVLTALVQAFSGWHGEARVLVGLERHGRESVGEGMDLSRTVGWFTSFFPVLLELPDSRDPGAAIKAIKEQLRRIPGRGIGYGVQRYLSADNESLRALAQPEVVFNYTPRAELPIAEDAVLRPLALPTSTRSPRNQRGHLLEINAFVTGDRLEFHWSFSGAIHQRATIEGVAREHVKALRALIAHCLTPEAGGYTPSDFPEAGLSQEELDRFMDTLS